MGKYLTSLPHPILVVIKGIASEAVLNLRCSVSKLSFREILVMWEVREIDLAFRIASTRILGNDHTLSLWCLRFLSTMNMFER